MGVVWARLGRAVDTQFGAKLRMGAGPDCQLRMCKQANKPSRRQGLIVIVSREGERGGECRGQGEREKLLTKTKIMYNTCSMRW